ncbi:hypothetical protein EAO73_28875 [Streptomyces sp. col6]|uniref:hypothetical protein n=1 Tax=Streptomyces sp. col6 TaxID=2478958 RepID=UPI0011CD863B|nr:hypothetical protein [Streptomyces sp. col6]TXR99915.1 hypothetical protein EAO73_28875 [Streptomyces sp. col6]
MFTTPERGARSSGRTVVLTAAALVTAVLSVAAVIAGNRVWQGAPYPTVDPDAVAQRIKDRSDWVYEGFALSGKYAASPGTVATGSCYYRGLRSVAHIDQPRDDVYSFGLGWSVPDVPEATAEEAQRRVRGRLEQQGWKVSYEGDRSGATFRERGYRFLSPDGSDKVDVRWNTSTTTLFVSVYAPCGQVPDGFSGYNWPAARWSPKERAAGS